MYLDFFGLRELPFSLTPNPRFLYPTPSHRGGLEKLLHGVTNRRGFCVLFGDVGTGKTTLCRALIDRLGENFKTALILDPRVSETQLLRAILHEFGVLDAKGDRLALREQLNRFLLDTLLADQDAVLILDEAQHLSLTQLEQIRLLSNLETDERKLLQIVLVGQCELAAKLADPRLRQLSQRIMIRHRLESVGDRDTGRYIRHRLCVAGGNGNPSFDRDALDCIFRHAAGIPRLMNAIADMALVAAFGAREQVVTSIHVDRAVDEMAEGCI